MAATGSNQESLIALHVLQGALSRKFNQLTKGMEEAMAVKSAPSSAQVREWP